MIKVDSLFYTYPGQKSASAPVATLKGLNFDIQSGEIFGFLGPSGSGKSTTQKLMTGILGGYQGKIEVDGRELGQWGQDYYRKIGVGFELPNHFNKLSALENLKLFGAFYNHQIDDPMTLLDRLGLADDANKPVKDFSKGMKMRLNFVRAILHRPDIVFLDEPTAGLDPVNTRKLKTLIRELKQQGKTIFLTTHHMQDAEELCDRIAFIVDGKLAIIDSPEALKLKFGKPGVKVSYADPADTSKTLESQFDLATLGSNVEFTDLLRNHTIRAIHSQEASIEEVFIQTTGRKLL